MYYGVGPATAYCYKFCTPGDGAEGADGEEERLAPGDARGLELGGADADSEEEGQAPSDAAGGANDEEEGLALLYHANTHGTHPTSLSSL